jgi:recombination protein RecR
MLPRALRALTQELTRLPGIGPKTAERLALHLLRQPSSVVARLANTIKELHGNVRICSNCYNLAERESCDVCRSQTRRRSTLCVVEDALDVEAVERTGAYDGLYHVLGGVLSPIEGVGPEELSLSELLDRITNEEIAEVIIALDHKMESDATTRYIVEQLQGKDVQVTRLARGLPTGGDIEFADAQTLSAALNQRTTV